MPERNSRTNFPFGFAINPETSWARFFNPQFFISCKDDDPTVENHVLGRVGSYSHQLGQVLDVLGVLVARLEPDQLTPQERRVLDELTELFRGVKAAVADYRGPRDGAITVGDIDRLVAGPESLSRSDPATHRGLTQRLRGALDDHAAAEADT